MCVYCVLCEFTGFGIQGDSILSYRHTNPLAVMSYLSLGMMMNFAVHIEFQ